MPVIKANAYGHGAVQVAQALVDADGFAVAQLSEALNLRNNGIEKPITIFQGFANAVELRQMRQYNLQPAISQDWQVALILEQPAKNPLDIWLKVNTGMGRLGFKPDAVADVYQALLCCNGVNQVALMTHFANADDPGHRSNQLQRMCFQDLLQNIPSMSSASNSAAIISELLAQQDWLRPGIMLYGGSPVLDQSAKKLKLMPVMTLNAQLIAINNLSKGDTVGYGNTWVCPQDMPVGIVNIGYGDGYPRMAPNGTPLAINAQKSQLIGRVSMDSLAVDLRGIHAQCGDTVELWGQQISVDEVAHQAKTISYELLCNVGRLI